ncbi:hypothetical protein KC330_g8030 [Hortaea werneckii]|nr:hypothetical protein KC330_g8030 [Hortaea werneckii]
MHFAGFLTRLPLALLAVSLCGLTQQQAAWAQDSPDPMGDGGSSADQDSPDPMGDSGSSADQDSPDPMGDSGSSAGQDSPDPMGANIPSAVYTTSALTAGSSNSSNDFVFAVNIDSETDDVYFHMSSPSGNDWMGVGFGSKMKDSLMLIAYPSSNGTGMTLSPRLGKGHTEPEYTDEVSCEMIYNNDLPGANTVVESTDTLKVDAVCRNATSWSTGKLDYKSSSQDAMTPFIFAVGPGEHGHAGPGSGHLGLKSNSKSAGLERHEYYGHFNLDLSEAVSESTSKAGVPRPNSEDDNDLYISVHAGGNGRVTSDGDPAPIIHGFIMCLTFVIIFPLGALILRLLERVILHAAVQFIGMILVTAATAGGIVVSRLYVRSKDFATAHQILGILLFIALWLQLGLGILHHRIFKKQQRKTLMGKIHLYLGPIAVLIGIINAPIGFHLAGNSHLGIPYAIIVVVVAIIMLLARRFLPRFFGRNRRRKQASADARAAQLRAEQGEGYQYPQFGQQSTGLAPNTHTGYGGPSAASYEHLGPPPAYGRTESYRSEDVPLQTYGGEAGVQHPRPTL